MMRTEPYFMKNKEWYYHDPKEWKYKLTDKAPPKARKSYEEFYSVQYDPLFWGKTQEQIDATLRAEKKRLLEGE